MEGDRIPLLLQEVAGIAPMQRLAQEVNLIQWDIEIERLTTAMQEDREYFIENKSWKRVI